MITSVTIQGGCSDLPRAIHMTFHVEGFADCLGCIAEWVNAGHELA